MTPISSKIGITYIPVTIFHINEIVTASAVATIWAVLSDPKYFGFNPTAPRDIDDRNGRN